MLSKEEFISRTFAIAADMSGETKWASHVLSVEERFIRFKNCKMWTPSASAKCGQAYC